MPRAERLRTGILTVVVATTTAVLLLFFGKALVDLFKIEPGAFLIGAGLIVVVFGIRMVIAPSGHDEQTHSKGGAMRLAVYPLAIPLLITPPAVATLTAMGIDAAVNDASMVATLLALLAVMAINLAAFVLLAFADDAVPTPVWEVAGRLLGVFLVAFGVTVILQGIELATA